MAPLLSPIQQRCIISVHIQATVMTLSFQTGRSGQTVQTQIRLLLEEQSDQGLHCLLLNSICIFLTKYPLRFGLFVRVLGRLQQSFLASENLGTLRYVSLPFKYL